MKHREFIITGTKINNEEKNIYIKNGKIVDILPKHQIPDSVLKIEKKGIVLPALIDIHTHLRDPGQEYKEDIISGLKAAAAGGFSHIFTMANTDPVNDTAPVTRYLIEKAKKHFPYGPHLYPVAALTKGLKGKELAPLQELKEAGCIAASNDGIPVKNNELFRRAVEYASNANLLVLDHCEDPDLAKNTCINEGEIGDRLGLKGQPTIAEAIQVARDILISSYLDIPIHLCHISCEQSVELIYWAKQKGIKITAETCPHYLIWDESILEDYNTNAKVNPPLRTKNDVEALRQAVREKIIDVIATDHAPHAQFEKEVPFALAPNGISGLDTALCLLFELVSTNVLSIEDIISCMHKRPIEIFSLDIHGIEKDYPANFIIFDTHLQWIVDDTTMISKGKNTPCFRQKLKGKVTANFCKGNLIYEFKDMRPIFYE
ncbi:dihydroorotase [Desulfothermus sp.]